MTPRYLERIKATASLMSLTGNRLLIELLEETEQTTKSGIITTVQTKKFHDASDNARVAVVLAKGPGYETEAGEKVDVPYEVGDYVLVNQHGVKAFGEFFGIPDYKSNSIGLITDDLIQGRISNFSQFQSILRS